MKKRQRKDEDCAVGTRRGPGSKAEDGGRDDPLDLSDARM